MFEFVISPTEKVVTGAVYTPEFIRNYIVDNVISNFPKPSQIKIADIACGCGGFLLTIAAKLHNITNRPFSDIYKENIFGIDIADYSILRTKLILSLFAILNGEDKEVFEFNLFCDDSLTFDWRKKSKAIKTNDGFDAIVGNPPYVCSRNMNNDTLEVIKKWRFVNLGIPISIYPSFKLESKILIALVYSPISQ
ncbi:N-6 DNA methylase [Sphingobacterium sp. E70]|uniref:Eco57I restriction-modification methylase domain-containing protein n=1 Tax=Sphingobacterium sp. E70 TaxID=2853439 RepID=UPI00211D076C|nr:N-6 DNA methylase [Sphingobacterium sp. E70]ULT25755.1 N-6 DNA methylase [Sphingobacterium sp. E70]